MADIVDSATRSRMMAGIRARDTRPERILRSSLHRRGLRYRLHVGKLPGKPDLVFPRFRAAIFVHGCFWHHHAGCRYASTPATRSEFWEAKFADNVARDIRNRASLQEMGWRVAVVWECALRKGTESVAETVRDWLASGGDELLEL